jgi:hypothetical protein
MPVYMVHGFRWPRAGFTGIRVYIVLHNLEDATAEYVQQPATSRLLTECFKKTDPDIVARLPDLQFIEQYDPEDTDSATAVSQPYAYVAAKVITLSEPGAKAPGLSWNPEDLAKDSPLEPSAMEALTQLRDKYAAGERIGWWIVYNGDPDRAFPHSEEDDSYDEYDYDDDDDDEYTESNGDSVRNSTAPETPPSPAVSLALRTSLILVTDYTDGLRIQGSIPREVRQVFWQVNGNILLIYGERISQTPIPCDFLRKESFHNILP